MHIKFIIKNTAITAKMPLQIKASSFKVQSYVLVNILDSFEEITVIPINLSSRIYRVQVMQNKHSQKFPKHRTPIDA